MVDATVSMVLNRLGPMIEEMVRDEICLLIGSPDEAKKLSAKLQRIQQVLRDAERKMVTDPKIKSWLDKLHDISYEIDDFLDDLDWRSMKLQIEDPPEKVSYFLQCLCFTQVVERRNINLNIKQLNERLDSIGQQNEYEFNFIPNMSHNSQEFKRILSTSFVDVGEVRGRDHDKEVVVSNKLSESSSQIENGVQIISIVGTGGMGKTTLAQLLFNDDRINDNFHVKIWVCVSQPFDEIKIAKAILEALNMNTPNLSQFETLLQRIVNDIFGKKFLLVLDDVWTEDDTMWKPLKVSLNNGSPGSKVLVTTRNTKVAQVMGSTQMQIHSLKPLSDSDCWSVLSQIAYHGRIECECDILKDTGLKIVKKCKGLPLAAKAIGSLLRFKSSLEEWRNVLESEMWELEKARTDIFPFLVMSYDELHPVAKRCFSYCAIFPKDKEIRVETLVRMWWAQGFLSSSNGGSDDAELKGREIFDDLAMRSFFQDFEKDDLGNHVTWCKMHDIVHDFAQFLTENECLIVEKLAVGELAHVQNARHLNLLLDKAEANTNIIPIYHDKCRSFLSTNYDIPENSLGHLKRVRVLILYYRNLKGIPKEIGSLIHLRYLDLSYNHIEELPETICDLYNLQTLMLEGCYNLFEFPQGIHKLRKLRHLLTFGTKLEFPQGMEELTNLRTLNYIFIASRKNLVLLRNLNQLRGYLCLIVEDLDEADDIVAAESADLKSKNFIRDLRLYCKRETKSQVFEALQPHPDLQILEYRAAFYIPKWITTLTNLRQLKIGGEPKIGYSYASNESCSLHALRNLAVLEDLCLYYMYGMERLSLEFVGIDLASTTRPTELYAFPRLKRLRFIGWNDWEEWEDISEEEEKNINISIFPCLQVLEFNDCPELRTLPHRLLRKASSLNHVSMHNCYNLCFRYKDICVTGSKETSHFPMSYFQQV